MSEFPILKYIVNVTNKTSGQYTRTDLYNTAQNAIVTHTISDTPKDCHLLDIEVFAENFAGISPAEKVSIEFPVGRSVCCITACCCVAS